MNIHAANQFRGLKVHTAKPLVSQSSFNGKLDLHIPT